MRAVSGPVGAVPLRGDEISLDYYLHGWYHPAVRGRARSCVRGMYCPPYRSRQDDALPPPFMPDGNMHPVNPFFDANEPGESFWRAEEPAGRSRSGLAGGGDQQSGEAHGIGAKNQSTKPSSMKLMKSRLYGGFIKGKADPYGLLNPWKRFSRQNAKLNLSAMRATSRHLLFRNHTSGAMEDYSRAVEWWVESAITR